MKHVALVSLILALFLSCDGADKGPPVQDVGFTIVESDLGESYASTDLGIVFTPPVGWLQLEESQKQQVADALMERAGESDYDLQIDALFLDTSSLSFAAVSVIPGLEAGELREYVNQLAEQVGQRTREISPDTGVDAMRFKVGDLVVDQLRHLMPDRAATTLVFVAPGGQIAQIDYSIPVSVFELEVRKLESSVGSLQPID